MYSNFAYVNLTINQLLSSTTNALLSNDYSSIKFNELLLESVGKLLEELKRDIYSSQRKKMFLSLTYIRLMDYVDSPNESKVHQLCQVIYHNEATRAMPLDELNELKTMVFKHMCYLLSQNFFKKFKNEMLAFVELHKLQLCTGTSSQEYSRARLNKDFQNYARKCVEDQGVEDEDELYLRQRGVPEKRKSSSPARRYISPIAKDSAINISKKPRIEAAQTNIEMSQIAITNRNETDKEKENTTMTARSKRQTQQIELHDSKKTRMPTGHNASPMSKESVININKKPIIESNILELPAIQANIKTSPKSITSRTHNEIDSDNEKDNTAMKTRSKRQTRNRVRIDESDEETSGRRDALFTIQDISELDFGDEQVSKKKKKQSMNQLKPIENVIKSPKKDATLSFKRKPVLSSSDTTSNDEDQENRGVAVDDNAQNNMMVVATTSRGNAPVEYAESDTDEDDSSNRRRLPDQKRTKWTHLETLYLVYGVHKYGKGNWSIILNAFRTKFGPKRDKVALKDKWRVLESEKNVVELNMYKKQVLDYIAKHGIDRDLSF